MRRRNTRRCKVNDLSRRPEYSRSQKHHALESPWKFTESVKGVKPTAESYVAQAPCNHSCASRSACAVPAACVHGVREAHLWLVAVVVLLLLLFWGCMLQCSSACEARACTMLFVWLSPRLHMHWLWLHRPLKSRHVLTQQTRAL
jgi:hypothetical protein